MAESNRNKLISIVSETERDVSGFCELIEKLNNEKSLDDMLVTLSKGQRSEVWDGVLGICMSTLMELGEGDSEGSDGVSPFANQHRVLRCITSVASASLKSVQSDMDERAEIVADSGIPPSLYETAVLLHGIMPTLPNRRNGLKNTVCALFESWWTLKLLGGEELMTNTILYLLDRSTQLDAAKVDVGRLVSVHKVLEGVNLSSDSVEPLVGLLLKCAYHPNFVTSTQGLSFLVFLFTLSDDIAKRLHDTIKIHLPAVPVAWGSKYGDIYFRAWQKTSGAQREFLETNCIQDLMHCACRLPVGSRGSLWHTVYKFLNCLHGKKSQRGVEDMLVRLYGPILWRSLTACNSDVRLSACQIMFSAFPLQGSTMEVQEQNKALQKQIDIMHSLLQDPVPAVRLAAVNGVGRVLSIYWELIPTEVATCFITTLLEDLAYDITSPLIREAVIKVMFSLIDNHLALPVLAQVLPNLKNFIHDVSERVRHAMVDLLLKLKGLRAVKYYNVVPADHLLARLAVETSDTIRSKLMTLIYKSVVPASDSPQQQLERCKALLLSNPGAARHFYLHLHKFLDTEDLVRYMIVLCRYLVESARHIKADRDNHNDSQDNGTNEEGDGHDAPTPRQSGRSKAKKKKVSNRDQPNGHTDDEDEPEQQLDQTMLVYRGIAEAVYLMYLTVSPKLSADDDQKPMAEGLAKKLSVTVREMMSVAEDPELNNILISLAGQLPSKSLPLTSQSLFNRIRRLKSGVLSESARQELITTVKTLVQWGKSDILVEMVKESFRQSLMQDDKSSGGDGDKHVSKESKKQQPKKKVGFVTPDDDEDAEFLPFQLAVEVIETMLSQPECLPTLRARHRPVLMSVVKLLQSAVVERLRVTFSMKGKTGDTCDGGNVIEELSLPDDDPRSVSALVRLYKIHLRLAAFLTCSKEAAAHGNGSKSNSRNDEGSDGDHVTKAAERSLLTALTWAHISLLPSLKATAASADGQGQCGMKKKESLRQLLEATMKITSSVMMAGCCCPALLDEAVQLCIGVIRPANENMQEVQTRMCVEGDAESNGKDCNYMIQEKGLVRAAMTCVYQLLSLRPLSGEQHNQGTNTQQEAAASGQSEGTVCSNTSEDSSRASNRQENERYAEVAGSFMSMLFKSLSLTSGEREGEDSDNSNQITKSSSKEKGSDDLNKTEKSKGGSKHLWVDFLREITPLVSELIQDLTRHGRPELISHQTVRSALVCIRADVERACRKDQLLDDAAGADGKKENGLPPLASAVFAAVKKRQLTFRLFVEELENCFTDSDPVSIHQAQALVYIASIVKTTSASLLSSEAVKNLGLVLSRASRPPGMDEDIFRDYRETAGKQIENLKEVINVN